MKKSHSFITVQRKRHLSNPSSPERKHTNKEKYKSTQPKNKSYENQATKPNSSVQTQRHDNDKNKTHKKSTKEQKF